MAVNGALLSDLLTENSQEFASLRKSFEDVCARHEIDDLEVLFLLRKSAASVPVEVFSQGLPPLEALVSYLRTHRTLECSDIARLIGRDPRVVWASFAHAKNRQKERGVPGQTACLVPLAVFRMHSHSVLEAIVFYLKKEKRLRITAIASLLNKQPTTIYTVYTRALAKAGVKR